mgnify:CR=1 FL=1
MLTYALEKNGSSSLYTQLYGCIRRDILSGALPPRQKLPSKRALAQHLEVSIITVQNAYEQLAAEGYIYSVAGKGSFAASGGDEQQLRIRELTEQLTPVLEELKTLGYTQEALLQLWKGGESHA